MAYSTKPVAVVTGGSKGIGAAIVKKFSENGWLVATCARRLCSDSPAQQFDICDVADPLQVKNWLSNIGSRFGRIDCLINNASIAGSNSLDPNSDDEFWHKIIATNLDGVYYCCKYALSYMNQGGHIVNIASVLGHIGVSDQSAYCAAKHGVIGFTRSLAKALSSRQIRVNVISPGWVDTDMARQRMEELSVKDSSEILKDVPLGRFVEPSEIAEMVYFLCSNKVNQITGQAIVIDGGYLA